MISNLFCTCKIWDVVVLLFLVLLNDSYIYQQICGGIFCVTLRCVHIYQLLSFGTTKKGLIHQKNGIVLLELSYHIYINIPFVLFVSFFFPFSVLFSSFFCPFFVLFSYFSLILLHYSIINLESKVFFV